MPTIPWPPERIRQLRKRITPEDLTPEVIRWLVDIYDSAPRLADALGRVGDSYVSAPAVYSWVHQTAPKRPTDWHTVDALMQLVRQNLP